MRRRRKTHQKNQRTQPKTTPPTPMESSSNNSSSATLNIQHVGSQQRGSGRVGPRYRVLDETGRPLLVEKMSLSSESSFQMNEMEQRIQQLLQIPHDNIVR